MSNAADINTLVSSMENLHITALAKTASNTYAADYKCLAALLEELDDLRCSANIALLKSQQAAYSVPERIINLLFTYKSHHSYKYYDDSDIMNTVLTVFPANMQKFQKNYEYIMRYNNSDYDVVRHHLTLADTSGNTTASAAGVIIHPDKYATFLILYAHYNSLANYFIYNYDAAYLPTTLLTDISDIILTMEADKISLNPLNECYRDMSEHAFELFILLVVAVRHLKILSHICTLDEIMTYGDNISLKIMRLVHNFLVLIINITC